MWDCFIHRWFSVKSTFWISFLSLNHLFFPSVNLEIHLSPLTCILTLHRYFLPPHVRHIKRMTCAHLYIWKLNGAQLSKKKEEPSLCCALIETCSGHRSRLTALLIHSTPVCYSAGRHTRLTFLSLPLFLPLTPYLLSPSPPPIIHLSQGVIVAPCAHCLMLF